MTVTICFTSITMYVTKLTIYVIKAQKHAFFDEKTRFLIYQHTTQIRKALIFNH